MRKAGSGMVAALIVLMSQACNHSGKNDKVATDTFLNDVRDTISVPDATTTLVRPEDTAHNVHPVELNPVVSGKDVKFASIAAADGLNAVNNGKMAQQKATNFRVKSFALMLVNNNTKFGNELAVIAKDKKITLPALPGPAEMRQANRLAVKEGIDFDQAYVDAIISDQKKAITLYENGSKMCDDAKLKAFAAKTLIILKMELDSALAVHGGIQ